MPCHRQPLSASVAIWVGNFPSSESTRIIKDLAAQHGSAPRLHQFAEKAAESLAAREPLAVISCRDDEQAERRAGARAILAERGSGRIGQIASGSEAVFRGGVYHTTEDELLAIAEADRSGNATAREVEAAFHSAQS